MSHPRIAFSHPDFRYYSAGRFLTITGHMMLTVAIGQYVFELTHDPLHLGYVGLVLFLPKFIFTLFAGQTADRYDRRMIVLVCRLVQVIATLGLISFVLSTRAPMGILYALLFAIGTTNAYEGPATVSLVPHLVPLEHLSNAITWNSSILQFALIAGPAIGGWVYAFGGALWVFITVCVLRALSFLFVLLIRTRTGRLQTSDVSWHTLLAGLRFVFEKKIILGTISLDLFAVLLGGAVALMPIYANEILHVGPKGLGILRSAPSVGAALMAFLLAVRPIKRHAGPLMLVCVAIFGLATIAFGLSTNFFLSLAALAVLGASDMVSMVIRGVLVQTRTPSEMRGRVSAVNLVFIGASNELGEFESGLTANLFGTVPAVMIGGIGTLIIVGLWTWLFPDIRKLNSLT